MLYTIGCYIQLDAALYSSHTDVDVSLIRDQSTVRPTVTSTTTRRPIIIPTLVPTDGNKWLVFDGHSWILYDFSQLPDEYLQKNSFETFNIRFKTDSPDGLLWYTGRDDHHSHLTLKVKGFPHPHHPNFHHHQMSSVVITRYCYH